MANRIIFNGYFLGGNQNEQKRSFFLYNEPLLSAFSEIVILERSELFRDNGTSRVSLLRLRRGLRKTLNLGIGIVVCLRKAIGLERKRSAAVGDGKGPVREVRLEDSNLFDPPEGSLVEYFPNELVRAQGDTADALKGFALWRSRKEQKLDWIDDVLALEGELLKGAKSYVGKLKSWLHLFCGLGRSVRVLESLELSPSDTVVIWSEHSSGARILIAEASKKNAKLIYSEYGELPGTIFVSECGMFHESWPYQNREQFSRLSVSEPVRSWTNSRLKELVEKKVSTKTYHSPANGGELLGGLDKYDAVIYVNGDQSFCSGLLPRRSTFSQEYSPYFDSNLDMLSTVAEVAFANNWLVLFKNHPNIEKSQSWATISENIWGPHVRLLGNIDIYSVLEAADVVVSLGSKSTFLALASGVPVLLAGPYSITEESLKYGLVEMKGDAPCIDIIERGINQLLDASTVDAVDEEGYLDFISRLIQYDLYEFEESELLSRGKGKFAQDLDSYLRGERISLTDHAPSGSSPHMSESGRNAAKS
tara:strand:- start:5856 stop:7457 length:1602 start_codon:yes stop_codon:yes gene_type:complete